MSAEFIKVGKRGTLVIPVSMREHFGFNEGDMVIAEDHGDGVLLKPAVTLPMEMYSKERKAEFLLSNAVSKEDYEEATKEVIAMGVNPKDVKHYQFSLDAKVKGRKSAKSHD